ncbi:NAD(P)H-dependent oxidoreductase [Lactobacillus sp. 3B(2020)]|nr:NAD(P)H-dependent oxidoreductase [Lactobacillus sp. 3B(2020)]
MRQHVLAIANQRFATKKFDPSKHIDDEDWQAILQVGRLAPSSYGYEPWRFILLKNKKLKDAIRSFSWGAINSLDGADKILLILVRKDVSYDADYVKHLVMNIKQKPYSPDSPQSQHFKVFQERDLDIHTTKERFEWATRQAYIAMANMMTAATELGIDTCPIEGFNYSKMNQFLANHQIMDPEHWQIAVMVSFGYRDQPIKPKVRQPLADIYKEV